MQQSGKGQHGDIATFRGDFAELAAVMQRSWSENPQTPLFYTEPFLRSAFEYPGSSYELAPAIYSLSGLAGFIAGFPRSARWNGQDIRLVLSTFLTASSASKGAGYGLRVWRDLLDRCRSAGFDGKIDLCVEGEDMHRMMPGMARLFRLNSARIFSIEFLVRFLRPSRVAVQPTISSEEIDLFLELASAIPNGVILARTWTREEADWQCRRRLGAVSVSARHDTRRGMLTGYIMEVASRPPSRVLLVEDMLWGNLNETEQAGLLRQFLAIAAAQGATTASCPVLRYASTSPLTTAGFRRSTRILHAYLTLWNGLDPKPLPSMYMDVI